MGGRTKGTTNKATQTAKEWVQMVLDEGRDTFQSKLAALPPKDYVSAYLSLLSFTLPKQTAFSIEAQIEAEYRQLQALLIEAPEEAVERIAARMLEIQKNADLGASNTNLYK